VATKDPSHDADSTRSTIRAAAVLHSINIAMFLAVAVIVYLHVLTSHDASAAIAPASSTRPSAAATALSPTIEVTESPPRDSLGQAPERTDNSRECRPSAAIDSNCIYN
jgi:hypothetical protein